MAVEESSADDVIKFLSDEHENPQLVMSILIKLSRKFMEVMSFYCVKYPIKISTFKSQANSYTKIKAMLIIHKLLLNVRPEKASQNLMQSLEVLRRETDEKYGKTLSASSRSEP